MQTPIEIDFQGMAANPRIRTEIADHVSDLEHHSGRVTFAEEEGDKGTQASTVTLLGKHGLRA